MNYTRRNRAVMYSPRQSAIISLTLFRAISS